jgi:RNA 2',3'-cyclic 3'-phosphodiesterase
MRAFIAVGLAGGARERIEKLQGELVRLSVKLIEPQNLHLTLKFLGTIPDDEVPNIAKELSAIRINPFKIMLSTAGAFPNVQSPRVIWVGCEASQELFELKNRISQALPGYKDDHAEHKSHITLARIKNNSAKPQDPHEAIENIIKILNVAPIELEVKEFKLYKSTLTQTGPVYEEIRS